DDFSCAFEFPTKRCESLAESPALLSFGGSLVDAYRLTGISADRILKGEKPADLPVQQRYSSRLQICCTAYVSCWHTFPVRGAARFGLLSEDLLPSRQHSRQANS